MVKYKQAAVNRIMSILNSEEGDGCIFRIDVGGIGADGFTYEFSLDEEKYRQPVDVVIEEAGFTTIIDPRSAEKLKGATIDWQEDDMGRGQFVVDNPNNPQLDYSDPRVQQLVSLFEEEINPAVASHGGFIELVDFKDDTVFLKMGGGCQGCGQADVTLRNGIETVIKTAVPSVKEIIDVTEHAKGRNPYFA